MHDKELIAMYCVLGKQVLYPLPRAMQDSLKLI